MRSARGIRRCVGCRLMSTRFDTPLGLTKQPFRPAARLIITHVAETVGREYASPVRLNPFCLGPAMEVSSMVVITDF
jgi:hypothetical protein